MSAARTFTVSEANALLPEVIPILQQLQALQQSIQKTNSQLEAADAKLSQGNGHPIAALRQQVKELTLHRTQLLAAFQSALQSLEDLGVQLKDPSIGLVDFLAVRAGEPILLCWKLGEERVQFWHTPHEGYAGRQPLET